MKNIIVFPNGTRIGSGGNAERSIKSCAVTECVNSSAELTMGSACCSCLEAQILTKGVKLGLAAGELIELHKADGQGNVTKFGTFRLEIPSKKSDNIYKITAYDRVADLDKDLSSWLKSLTGWPYKLPVFAEMVCEACDLHYEPSDILNAEFEVWEFYKAGVTGRQIMQWIGEIAGRFCRANADGDITFDWYTSSGVTIRPTGDRYYFGGALTYDDYEVAPIDAVQLRLADGEGGALWPPFKTFGTVTATSLRIRRDAGTGYAEVGRLAQGDQVEIQETTAVGDTTWGRIEQGWICLTGYVELETIAADNPYVITGNAILLARVTEDLKPYLKTVQSHLAALPAYKPCKVSLPAGMDIRAGQTVQVVDKHGNAFTTLVMTKTQAGQRDTLECTGSPRRDSSTAANNKSAAQAAQQAVENQTHEDVMNHLTKNGKIQGIYVRNDKWYVNAEAVQLQNLKVKAADITGVISVLDGTNILFSAGDGNVSIAGWGVTKDSIKHGTLGTEGSMWLCRTGTEDVAKIAEKEQSDWCIAIGKNFGVDKYGKLYATGAVLSGSITADNGSVGSWHFSQDGGLYCDKTWNNEVSLHPNHIMVSWIEYIGEQGAVTKSKKILWRTLAERLGVDA